MMNPLPAGLFGLQQQDPTAGLQQFAPQYNPAAMGISDPSMPMAAPVAPASSFVWGGAGDRLSDADIAQREQQDRQQIAAGMDFSPVQSWAQGAARVAQALVGKLDKKHTDAASAENVAANNAAIASLNQPGGAREANIAALLTDGTLSDGAHEYAKMKLAALNKPAPAPNDFERLLIGSGIQPGTTQWAAANGQRAQVEMDPTMTTSLPGGGLYVGPRSGLLTAMQGGGGQASTAGGVAQPPATLPPDFDFGAGGPTHPASATFR